MTSTSSGCSARSARSARWTIPSSSHAPEPSSSFSSGMPKRSTRLARRAGRARPPRRRGPRPSSGSIAGQRLVPHRRGPDEERHHEVVEVEPRLADERAQRVGAPQPAEARGGEGAHARQGYVSCAAVFARPPPRPARRARPSVHGSSSTRSAKNSQIAREAASTGSATRIPGEPVQLAAREQAEDDEQRMQPQRVRHHVRDDDVPLDLVDEDEERRDPEDRDRVDDERVDRRRHRREPRADVGDHLDHRRPDPEQERVLLGARHEAEHAEQPHAEARARADDRREQDLPSHVAGERRLDPQRQRQRRRAAGSAGRSTRSSFGMSSSM